MYNQFFFRNLINDNIIQNKLYVKICYNLKNIYFIYISIS